MEDKWDEEKKEVFPYQMALGDAVPFLPYICYHIALVCHYSHHWEQTFSLWSEEYNLFSPFLLFQSFGEVMTWDLNKTLKNEAKKRRRRRKKKNTPRV